MRILLALGGNAMTSPDGKARPEDQIAAAEAAMEAVADLVAEGVDVVITHGNGPQVGNLLVKNEFAAAVVPPVPLDWCGAQTQGTLGDVLMNALDGALAARGIVRPTAALVTRTRVDAADPAFAKPSKPVGRYLSADEAATMIDHGETWEDRGERGWRRVVASPEPLEVLDAPAVIALVEAGFVVIANGGGGIPTIKRPDGALAGVEAVIDKDLGAALLARSIEVDRTRHRHRRRPRHPRVRHAGRARHRRGEPRGDARVRRGGSLRRRLDGSQGGRHLPLRRGVRPRRRHHRPQQHREGRLRTGRHDRPSQPDQPHRQPHRQHHRKEA
ncbi:hypothetical protein [Nocardioides convexus]|uniref:amino acid kinase family protein n=1 Tax=Nocardioides convexus TaxID=2712224 RepID=UPI0024185F17|nr:hypothetical protein [Nocardioides convexus]